jgi:hypothetical protein
VCAHGFRDEQPSPRFGPFCWKLDEKVWREFDVYADALGVLGFPKCDNPIPRPFFVDIPFDPIYREEIYG